MIKKILNNIYLRRISDILLSPVTLLSAVWYKYIRTATTKKMPISDKIFMKVGVLPIDDHYYQPMVNPLKHLNRPLENDRQLPGINWNIDEQLALLQRFNYNDELKLIPLEKKDAGQFQYYYNNNSFAAGDAEFLYNMIRCFKPKTFIEVGCGYSTKLAIQAETKNASENPADTCRHICIEPYEMPWLEQLNVEVIRSRVELVDKTLFAQLDANDILFIDSSHIIRPQGDVLFEILQVLPTLKKGVLVHVHDIFSPKDYPKEWIVDKHCLWNEQYLLEAFLSFNNQYRVIGALNFLRHHHFDAFITKCPQSGATPADEPGSFWITRN